MKVFEIITEHCEGGGNEIIRTFQYVTAHDDNIKTVMDHAAKHCFEYEKELMSVREFLKVTEHIDAPGEG